MVTANLTFLCFLCMRSTHLAFSLLQVWERVTIAEESESGKQISSEIQVPAQVSVSHYCLPVQSVICITSLINKPLASQY